MKCKAQNALLACTTALCTLAPWVAYALPQDGVVVAGSASIVTSAQAVDITQSSQKAIIDWRGFDIAPNEAARFYQPSANAVTLNRVNSTSATQIDGMLSANGNILIVNPNGVIFGKNSRVDVGGLVASTSDVDNHAFMTNAKPIFDKPGAMDAKISNAGVITAREAGLVGLVAPQVENSGVITAQLGRVTLASGDTFTLDFAGDGITQIAVTGDIQAQVVRNSGTIEANGGSILLTAAAARGSVDSLIENTGVLRATSVGGRQGSVVLYAEGSNAVIDNDASQKGIVSGRSTVVNAGTIDVSGKNAGEKGGKVQLLADQVAVATGAVIDASGYAGGGEVEVGGAKLGEGATPASLVTIMQEGSLIDVSSLMSGDAGSVVLWSDDRTEFGGEIRANAYGEAGDGGFVETSGKVILNAYGTVSATSRRGRKGEWFLDPANIEIISGADSRVTSSGANPITWASDGTGTSKVSVTTILNSINAGTNVIIQTGGNGVAEAGDITVSAAIVSTAGTLTGGATQSGSLTLSAYHSIYVNAAIDLYGGSVTLRANNAGAANGSSGNGVVEVAANITTHGGSVTIGGGSGASITAGSGYAVGDATHAIGVVIAGDIDAGGGAIIVNGMGSKTATSNNNNGVAVSGGGSLKSTGGSINVHGIGGGSGSGSILNVGVVVMDTGSAIIADGGAQVTITGTGGSGVSDGGYNYGVWVYTGGQISASGAGTVLNISGTGGEGTQGFNRGILIGNSTAMTSGSIAVSGGAQATVTGQGNTTSTGEHNHGLYVTASSAISVDGAGSGLSFILTGGGTGALSGYNYGLLVLGQIIGTNGASFDIRAYGGGGNFWGNMGIYAGATDGIRTTGGGSITIRVTKGVYGFGVYAPVANAISTSGSGNVTIYSDTLALDVANAFNVGGKLTIATYSDISLGVGATASYGMNLDDTLIGQMTAGSYQFGTLTTATGAARTQSVSLRTGVDFGTKDVTVVSGHDLTVDSAFSRLSGSTGKLTLEAVGNITVNSAITQRGDLLLRSNSQGAADGSSGTGAIAINAALTSNGANITIGGGSDTITAGHGYAVGSATQAVGVNIVADITAGSGILIINGMGNKTNTSGDNYGIRLQSATISSVGGTAYITGTGGGSGSSSNNHGVSLWGGTAYITATSGAHVYILGTGGQSATGNYNAGIVTGSSSKITADGVGTELVIEGHGGGSGSSTEAHGIMLGYGNTEIAATGGAQVHMIGLSGNASGAIDIVGGSKVTASGAGTVLLIEGTGASSGGWGSPGIKITDTNSAIEATAGANVTIIGNGGEGIGIVVENGGKITADGASTVLNIEGTGGGTGGSVNNYGVYVKDTGSTISATDANINIAGIGGNLSGTGGSNHGIYVNVANGIQTTGSGSITLKGVKGGQSDSYGIYVSATGGVITSGASGTRAITVYADTITLSAANAINAAGLLTVAPYSNVSFGVGATSGYGLSLSDAAIGQMTGGSYQFGTVLTATGAARTQDVSLRTGIDFGTKDVTVVSGHDLTVDATFTRAAGSTGKLTLAAVRNITVNNAITQRGELLLRANSQGAADGSSGTGAIAINAALASNGAAITLGGGSGTITEGSGYAVGNAAQVIGVNIQADINADSGTLIINGMGNKTATTNDNYGIRLQAATVSSNGGIVRITGVGGGSGASTDNVGIFLGWGTAYITATGGANVYIRGMGGQSSTGNNNQGVTIANNSRITADGTGTVLTIEGIGGGSGTSSNSYGILAGYSDTLFAATGGAQMHLIGTGGNSAGTGGSNSGVEIVGGSKITADGAGTVLTVEGTGSNASNGYDNNGVKVTNSNSAITATAGANVTITGQGSGASGRGVVVENAGKITADGAATVLTITGSAGGLGGSSDNYGVYVGDTGSTISATDADISITGLGGNLSGTAGYNHGIYVRTTNGIQTTGSGSITLKGVKGGQSTSYGVYVDAANGVITSGAAGTRAVTVYADTLRMTANAINAAGLLTVAPYSNVTFGVGATSGFDLNLDDTTLSRMTGGSYQFGTATTATGVNRTQDVTIQTGVDFGDKDVTVISGADILLASALTKSTGAGVANYLLRANGNISNTAGAGITASSGGINLTLDADYDNNSTGTITLNGATTLDTGTGSIVVNDAMRINGNTVLDGTDVTLNGNVTMDTTGTRTLTVDAGTGTATLGQIGTSAVRLRDLTVIADQMVLNGDLYGTGTVWLQPTTVNRIMSVAGRNFEDVATNLYLSRTEVGHLVNGWNEIQLGRLNGTGHQVRIGGDGGLTTNFYDNVVVNSAAGGAYLTGVVSMLDGASFTTTGNIDLVAGTSLATNGGNVVITDRLYSDGATVTAGGSGSVTVGSLYTWDTQAGGSINTSGGAITITGNSGEGGTPSGARAWVLNAGTGTINVNGTVNAGYDLTATAATINLTGDWGTSTALGAVSLTSTNSIALPSIRAGSILVRTMGANADITINNGETLTASGNDDAIVLAAKRNFINNSGSATPLVTTATGRWLVYSTALANNTRGGMLPDASYFNINYGDALPGGTNGQDLFLYSTTTAPVITYTTANDSVIYGDSYTSADFSYSYTSGLLTGDTLATIGLSGTIGFTTTYVAGTTNASATAYVGMINGTTGTLSSALGYTFNFVAGNLRVDKRVVTISGIAVASKTYDGTADATITGTATLNNALGGITLVTSGATATFADANANTNKAVTVSGYTLSGATVANYTLTQPSGFTAAIIKKDLNVTADTQAVTYGTAVPTGTISYNGFISGEDDSVLDSAPTVSSANSGIQNANTYVNNYTVSGGGDNNYNYVYTPGNLVVNQKGINVVAQSQSVTYGTTAPTTTTITYTGFVNGDDEGDLDTLATYIVNQTGVLNANSYANTYVASGASDTNYTFNYVNGTLTVTKKSLAVVANDRTIDYGDPVPATTTVSYYGFVNGDDENDLNALASGVLVLATSNPYIGTYNDAYISQGGADNNYLFQYVGGRLIVEWNNPEPPPPPPVTGPSQSLPPILDMNRRIREIERELSEEDASVLPLGAALSISGNRSDVLYVEDLYLPDIHTFSLKDCIQCKRI